MKKLKSILMLILVLWLASSGNLLAQGGRQRVDDKDAATLDAQREKGAVRLLLIGTEELHDGFAFRIPVDDKSIAAVAELIAAERECCRFLTFELTVAPNLGRVILRVTGPAGTKGFLRMTFCKRG